MQQPLCIGMARTAAQLRLHRVRRLTRPWSWQCLMPLMMSQAIWCPPPVYQVTGCKPVMLALSSLCKHSWTHHKLQAGLARACSAHGQAGPVCWGAIRGIDEQLPPRSMTTLFSGASMLIKLLQICGTSDTHRLSSNFCQWNAIMER